MTLVNQAIIIGYVVEILKHFHEKGLVFCDLKPENVMLSFENERIDKVRLIDLGALMK